MNKIGLIIHRELLNRIQKKSFLISTLLFPLIFPVLIALVMYISVIQKRDAEIPVVCLVDNSHILHLDEVKEIHFEPFRGDLKSAKEAFYKSDHLGLLYIPDITLSNPVGISFFTKIKPGPGRLDYLKKEVERQVRERKIQAYNMDKKILKKLKTEIFIQSIVLNSAGQEKHNSTKALFFIGMFGGILVYTFIFLYGAHIMNGVIEEKTSKIVEVMVSSVSSFQLMMGKIIGIALVSLLQFIIWGILLKIIAFVGLSYYGQDLFSAVVETPLFLQKNIGSSNMMLEMAGLQNISIVFIVFWLIFFFLGGYLLYGALFAAVGSAVDKPSEAQQFVFTITIPMLVSYIALFTFVLDDPHGDASVWLSIIPFTSPVVMVGRLGFGVPAWQLTLSATSLMVGFIVTTWVASRIYRIGILTHGSKMSYKILVKWFLMKR